MIVDSSRAGAPGTPGASVSSPRCFWVTRIARSGRLRRRARQIGSLHERIDKIGLDVDHFAAAVAPLAGGRFTHQLHHRRGVVLEPLPPVQGANAVGK